MTIESIDVVFYTCMFLLPGYIIQEIITSLMPSKQYSDNIKLLRFLGYSILNLAVWSWLYMIVLDELKSDQALHWILLSAITFITSCVTGFLIGIVRNKEWIRKIFSKIKIQIEHPIPTAWDYKFSKTKDLRWVIVSLSNGEVIYGKYCTQSLSSSDASNRDLYLEEVYIYEEGKPWFRVEGTDGIWISANEIKFIEFRK
jgi:hypothetical protein